MRIKTLLFFGISVFSVLFVVCSVLINKLAVSESIADIATEKEKLITSVVAVAVQEPIKNGSILEARARLNSFINSGFFECAVLEYNQIPISRCDIDTSHLTAFSTKLKLFTEDSSNLNPILSVFIDYSEIQAKASGRVFKFLFFIYMFGTILICFVYFILKRSATEILTLAHDYGNESNRKLTFKKSFIQEVNTLRDRVAKYFEFKTEEIKSNARNEVYRQVAHDIRSPIMALQNLKNSISFLDIESEALYASTIIRVQSISEDLLDKERISGVVKYPETNSAWNLKQTLEDLIKLKNLEPDISQRISFLCTNEQVFLDSVIDKNRLERIVSNIVNNAIEASPPNSKVFVECSKNSSTIIISITDFGIGMNAEMISKIGKIRFSTKEAGNGLGLKSIVDLITAWNGKIDIQSKIGVGTKITISFVI